MPDESPVTLSTGLPETVLPELPEDWASEFSRVLELPLDERRDAFAEIAANHPRFINAWAALAQLGRDPVESYAYARVGYHRGLDLLRASGWHGTGYVRWRNPSNRGFLTALDELRRYAGVIGEEDEEDRCALFLRQLDPDWDKNGPGASGA
jgi:hypothetical protein